jgi:hypothetical protein
MSSSADHLMRLIYPGNHGTGFAPRSLAMRPSAAQASFSVSSRPNGPGLAPIAAAAFWSKLQSHEWKSPPWSIPSSAHPTGIACSSRAAPPLRSCLPNGVRFRSGRGRPASTNQNATTSRRRTIVAKPRRRLTAAPQKTRPAGASVSWAAPTWTA